ncbi:MAG: serpin family protein [Clostridia bacterium]|nr:serpin family protein [Clostridia bacterium]
MKISHFSFCTAALVLLFSILFNLTGCAVRADTNDLMEGIAPSHPSLSEPDPAGSSKAADFAVRLFRECLDAEGSEKSVLISPLSVISALAMTANGAKGETLRQMEQVLGFPVSELNAYLYSYMSSLPENGKARLDLANSVWFTDDPGFKVEESFLKMNADYYGAGAYKVPFNRSTLRDINDWVREKTHDMIPQILNDIPKEAVMYLVNAMAFEGEWMNKYLEYSVKEDTFTTERGESRTAEFMYGSEHSYLDDGMALGFMKYYAGGDYAFVALLPNEGISISDYASTLTGEKITSLLADPRHGTAYTAIPKFEKTYGTEMSSILKEMGMTDAFDFGKADFSGLGTSENGNIMINRVIHKTFIAVNEQGTRAGAATAVEMTNGSAYMPEEITYIYLTRPFIYMLVDCSTGNPFFIGTFTDTEN